MGLGFIPVLISEYGADTISIGNLLSRESKLSPELRNLAPLEVGHVSDEIEFEQICE